MNRPYTAAAAFLFLCVAHSAVAQSSDDTRTQFPRLLQNSYISINVGAIDQPFSQAQLEPEFHAASIDVPRVDVRVMLIGHEFNRFVSAQASYMPGSGGCAQLRGSPVAAIAAAVAPW